MCSFLSAIILRSGEVITAPEHTDSHEDLITDAGLLDDGSPIASRNFVRVEFTPPSDFKNIAHLDQWKLKVDESETPSWFDHEFIRSRLEERVKKMLVSEARPILLGGTWILLDGAQVGRSLNARIVAMLGSSKVGRMYGSSKVGRMYGSSKVGWMYDSSKVERMYDSSTVERMYDSSTVG